MFMVDFVEKLNYLTYHSEQEMVNTICWEAVLTSV